MAFQKGVVTNPTGRRGTGKNKEKYIKAQMRKFMDNNLDGFLNDILNMSIDDKLKYMVLLMPYVLPKLRDTTLEIKGDIAVIWQETKVYENGDSLKSLGNGEEQ